MNESLYRKYRPMTFEDIAGQNHIKKYFKNASKKNNISHAYIFNGPRGTGKTTIARIISKLMNCKNPINNNPCNTCENCKSINQNAFMDVMELDAASNRGIDEIRQIRDSANYRPVAGKYKIYIIDEFHMLTREAFNALLKTLEEPPKHVIFILATTNMEKVPETIISRSQVINFKNISNIDIEERLKYICKMENIETEDSVLQIIAKKAKGGMRDAISLLEQVIKFSSDNILKKEELYDVLGIYDEKYIETYIYDLINGNTEKILKYNKEIYDMGKEPEILIEEGIENLFDKIKKEGFQNKYIFTLNELNEILKELKNNEDKKMVFNIKTTILSYINSKDTQDKKILENLEKDFYGQSETDEEDIIKNIMDFYTENNKKTNLALYYSIKNSEKIIQNNKIIFKFNETQNLEYQFIKKYLQDLKINISSITKNNLEIDIQYLNKIEKSEEDIKNSLF